MVQSEKQSLLDQLTDELDNFQGIVKGIAPPSGEIPRLKRLDVYGKTIPLNGVVGGDHIIYVDFKQRYNLQARIEEARKAGRLDVVKNLKRCRKRAGIVLLDVSGHQVTDALLAAMLHQAFLMGAIYELDIFGQITNRLFENLNTRFYNTSSMFKYFTMIYGEISTDATFRFFSAGHPLPVVFSDKHNRFMEIHRDLCMAFPPIGMQPSENMIDQKSTKNAIGFKSTYTTNHWNIMGKNDILLLYTDGLLEHSKEGLLYFPHRLEQTIQDIKHEDAEKICDLIEEDVLAFSTPVDDISFVVIKRL